MGSYNRHQRRALKATLKHVCDNGHPPIPHNGHCPACAIRREAWNREQELRRQLDTEGMVKRAYQWAYLEKVGLA